MDAMIQGASRGLGLELARQLLEGGHRVYATCRAPARAERLAALAEGSAGRLRVARLDVTDEASVEEAAHRAPERLDLLMNVAGILHEGDAVAPEKKLDHVEPAALHRVFAVNAIGPLLVAKHFADKLLHGERAVLANLSARVGSIGDNRLGGWYGYRGSKAAQNMFTKGLSIELGRKSRALIVLALHPGTVDTDLSSPFQRNVPEGKLFGVERAARQLLDVIAKATPEDTGRFFAWDGAPIEW